VVLCLLVEHHGLLDELRVELWRDRTALAEGTIDVGLDGASRHDGCVGLEVPFPEVDHSCGFPGSCAADESEAAASRCWNIDAVYLTEGDAIGAGIGFHFC